MAGEGIKLNALPVHTTPSITGRTSSNTDFQTSLRHAIGHGANVTGKTVGLMAPSVPGSALISAALNSAAGQLTADATGGGVGQMPGGGGGPNGDFAAQMSEMQQNMWSMNMYMVDLQQRFHYMNEHYSTISNLLKTKHETEKNSISNIR